MSDGESTTPAPRKRPTYGLPGPGGGAPAPEPTGDAYAGPASEPGPPAGGYPGPPAGGYPGPPAGGYPGSAPGGYPGPGAPGHYGPPPRRRRRGLVPLIIGLALLVIIAPVTFVGGIVWGLGSLMDDATSGPTVMEGGSGEVDLAANEMLIIYIPAEDADQAECVAESTGSGDVSSVPTSGTTQFPDGNTYEQSLGVIALEDTSVSVSCTGTEAPAYLGPLNVFGMAAPLLIGPIIGVLSGLIGLVLAIIGLVLLLRSRRS